MAGTIFGITFDDELFLQTWTEVPDPVKNALINSGAMVEDSTIAGMIQNGGSVYTIPFYNTLDGDPQNYDGQTDMTVSEVDGASQTGVVYGCMMGFFARNFTAELSGSDPMTHIANSVAKYWQKAQQKEMLNIINATFSLAGASGFAKTFKDSHILDLSSTTATAYKIGATDLNDLATQAMGDKKGTFRIALMHSDVAKTLENLELLEYWKQTDANGIQRPLNLASVNGMTVIVDDDLPVEAVGGEGDNKDLKKYTTYIIGEGFLRHAKGNLDIPVEPNRDPKTNGGQDELLTRIRETIHPNGFSFKVPTSGWTQSPTSAQLGAGGNWNCIFDPKCIPVAKLITNG